MECANFIDTSSSMEFHGTWSAPISMTSVVPWNSMEHVVRQVRWHEQGTWSAPISLTRLVPWNYMEFQGIPLNLQCANFDDTSSSLDFPGIPWNLEWANFGDTSSSVEHGIPWSASISITRAVPWNSVEFHGICSAPILVTRAAPWNSMEPKHKHIHICIYRVYDSRVGKWPQFWKWNTYFRLSRPPCTWSNSIWL